ncbi:MAG: tetratricopeptide repeat protein [Flavobacteriales bacterium]
MNAKVVRSRVIFFLPLFFLFLPVHDLNGQYLDPRKAKEFFKNKNYLKAMDIYKKLVEKEPNKPKYYKKAGICYLRTFKDRNSAAKYLEKALEKEGHDKDVWYYLGKAYMMKGEFQKAMKNFTKYQANKGLMGGEDDVAHLQAQCKTGKELKKHPLNVTFENLGAGINSQFPDYYPFVAKDESRLVFTSRRRRNKGSGKEFDGYYASDIWVLEQKEDGKGWGEAENAGRKVNSEYDEQAVGLSDDGNQMYVYIDHVKKRGDIYRSRWGHISFGRLEELGSTVNSEELETAGSISSDRKTLFFASERDGGEGGIDLWMTRKLPTGEWAKPQNLGDKINTKYDEGFPTLSYDNETLYFCSKGHQSMGGFDIFKAEWDREANTWSQPRNLGYPINDGTDNRTISFTQDGRHAYLSTFGKGGKGSLDLYKVTFNEVANRPVIFKVRIPSVQDTAKEYLTQPRVTVFDKNFEVYGRYSANPNTGSYTLALPPGQYTMEIQSEQYPLYEEKMKVTEADQEKGVVKKQVELSKASKKDQGK